MILIVDDDANLAENCSMYLESCGYDVRVAFNGADALSQIDDQCPSLLISDCCMPDMTGLQLSEQSKAVPRDFRFPILLMSGSLQCQVAPGTAYDAFIRKPFLAEHLLVEVQKLIKGNPPSIKQMTQAAK